MSRTRLRLAIVASLPAMTIFSSLTVATAQTADESAPPAETIIVPRLSDRADARPEKNSRPIDWEAVRALIQQTRERDADYERSLRAMALTRAVTTEERERMRPKGLRVIAPEQLQQLRRVSPESLARPRLPVLAPLTAETIGDLRLAARENAFTVFGELPNGATFELIGTRMRVVGGSPEAAKARLAERRRALKRLEAIDAPFLISRHEEGVDLSFSKFNAAYQINVTCNDETDARCAADEYVVSLAESLAILNEDAGGSQ